MVSTCVQKSFQIQLTRLRAKIHYKQTQEPYYTVLLYSLIVQCSKKIVIVILFPIFFPFPYTQWGKFKNVRKFKISQRIFEKTQNL